MEDGLQKGNKKLSALNGLTEACKLQKTAKYLFEYLCRERARGRGHKAKQGLRDGLEKKRLLVHERNKFLPEERRIAQEEKRSLEKKNRGLQLLQEQQLALDSAKLRKQQDALELERISHAKLHAKLRRSQESERKLRQEKQCREREGRESQRLGERVDKQRLADMYSANAKAEATASKSKAQPKTASRRDPGIVCNNILWCSMTDPCGGIFGLQSSTYVPAPFMQFFDPFAGVAGLTWKERQEGLEPMVDKKNLQPGRLLEVRDKARQSERVAGANSS